MVEGPLADQSESARGETSLARRGRHAIISARSIHFVLANPIGHGETSAWSQDAPRFFKHARHVPERPKHERPHYEIDAFISQRNPAVLAMPHAEIAARCPFRRPMRRPNPQLVRQLERVNGAVQTDVVSECRRENVGPTAEHGNDRRFRHIELGDDPFRGAERRLMARAEPLEALEIHAEADG